VHFVSFMPVTVETVAISGYAPDRCACGHLQEMAALPPGRLFGAKGDLEKRYHAFTRPN